MKNPMMVKALQGQLKAAKIPNRQPRSQIFQDKQVMPSANPMPPMKLGQTPGLMQALQKS
jgi:ABC-type thiamine transport system ATPase subunit